MYVNKNTNLKKTAKIFLLFLLFAIILQIVYVLQTFFQLVSPLIERSIIWEICKLHFFKAFLFTIFGIPCLVFYFYEKYLAVVISVMLIFVGIWLAAYLEVL